MQTLPDSSLPLAALFVSMPGDNLFRRLPVELFNMILEEPVLVRGHRCYDRTIASRLARTCRDSLRPSLDIIWRQIPDISVLFYLLPRDMWNLEEVVMPGECFYSEEQGWGLRKFSESSQWVYCTMVSYHARIVYCIPVFMHTWRSTGIHSIASQRRP